MTNRHLILLFIVRMATWHQILLLIIRMANRRLILLFVVMPRGSYSVIMLLGSSSVIGMLGRVNSKELIYLVTETSSMGNLVFD